MIRRHTRPLALALGACLLATVLAGCGHSIGPLRNPLDDRGSATFAPGTQNYPPPFPPPNASQALAPSPAPSSPAELESAATFAIDALAARTGLSVTRFTVVSTESQTWPDGCLGVTVPGMVCAQVVTPGYRVILRLNTGSKHEVHTGRNGAAAWQPQRTIHATVEATGTPLTLTDSSGAKVSALVAPGTQLVDVSLAAIRPGDRVVLGADDLNDGSPLRAVWLARDR